MIFLCFLVTQVAVRPSWSQLLHLYCIGFLIYGLATWETTFTRSTTQDGNPMSLARLTTVTVNGQEHAMTIRSVASVVEMEQNKVPILLVLHGGPGVSDIPFLYETDDWLEEHFIVVHYDQRSAGKSCRYYRQQRQQTRSSNHHHNLTIAQHVDDAVAIVEYLQHEFHQDKVYLVGGSWGSVLGMVLAKDYPHLFHAVALHGTFIDGLANELWSRDFILKQFPHLQPTQSSSSKEQQSQRLPMPPYQDRVIDLAIQRHWLNRAGGVYYKHPLEFVSKYIPFLSSLSLHADYFKHVLLSPEYSWGDKLRFESCSTVTTMQMMEELFQFNAYHQLGCYDNHNHHPENDTTTPTANTTCQLMVPILLLHGRHDHMCAMELVDDFYNALQAPQKQLVWFDKSGHFPDREESHKFQQTLLETFLKIHDDDTTIHDNRDVPTTPSAGACSWTTNNHTMGTIMQEENCNVNQIRLEQ